MDIWNSFVNLGVIRYANQNTVKNKENNINLSSSKDFFDEDFNLVTPKNKIRYQIGLFDHLLEQNEVIDYYESNEDFSNFTKNESKYLKFLEEIFEFYELPTFVEFDIQNLTNTKIIDILYILDYQDKSNWINFVRNINNSKSNFFQIDDIDELKMFFKIMTRELDSPIIHFENGKVNLLGNYDLFFPLFFENIELFEKYQKIAEKYDLNILKIEQKHSR